MAKHQKPDDELTEDEFLAKYANPLVTSEYLRARFAWIKNPSKEMWLAACWEYYKTEACRIHYPEKYFSPSLF